MATIYKKVHLEMDEYPIELTLADLKKILTKDEILDLAKELCWQDTGLSAELGSIAVKLCGTAAISAIIERSETIEQPALQMEEPNTSDPVLG